MSTLTNTLFLVSMINNFFMLSDILLTFTFILDWMKISMGVSLFIQYFDSTFTVPSTYTQTFIAVIVMISVLDLIRWLHTLYVFHFTDKTEGNLALTALNIVCYSIYICISIAYIAVRISFYVFIYKFAPSDSTIYDNFLTFNKCPSVQINMETLTPSEINILSTFNICQLKDIVSNNEYMYFILLGMLILLVINFIVVIIMYPIIVCDECNLVQITTNDDVGEYVSDDESDKPI